MSWTKHRGRRLLISKLGMTPPKVLTKLHLVDAAGERRSGKALGHLKVSALNSCPHRHEERREKCTLMAKSLTARG